MLETLSGERGGLGSRVCGAQAFKGRWEESISRAEEGVVVPAGINFVSRKDQEATSASDKKFDVGDL
jgi:hypothetical protein